jgi:hypothetical protein
LSNTRVFGLESGTFRAIASSAHQAGPSLGLAFIGPRCQVSGRFGVARECGPKGGCRLNTVSIRHLTLQQIVGYLAAEQPFDCVGSFKSEGLGIALFSKLEGEDPTSLVGLPPIRLVSMLQEERIDVLLLGAGN